MPLVVITGSAGLVGSESVRFFCEKGWHVVGLDNDMRSRFFGPEASTVKNRLRLQAEMPAYRHESIDVRDGGAVKRLFASLGGAVEAVIHAAGQPSHNWAATDPRTDFAVNALGTLNLLEATRQHAPEAPFIFLSTNKVYGDRPNGLPLIEEETRYSLSPEHPFAAHGIDESMSIDSTLHSLFGVSKTAADLMVQEYGRYFGMKTVSFRGGCLTGSAHAGAEQHGFLAYLVRSCVEGRPYRVYGYKGKQVRDNLDARDLAEAFWHYLAAPRPGEVYNIGGGISSNCSMIEAIRLTEEIVGRALDWSYDDRPRLGDHIWWVSDVGKFRAHYPGWRIRRGVKQIIRDISNAVAPA